jgi:hypothetical protein
VSAAVAAPVARVRRPVLNGPTLAFLLVFTAQFALGVWLAMRGFRWGDAFYRSTSALFVLHSSDPKLANIGFVWMPLPTLLNLPWVALYPAWPNVVSSGVASSATSAVCGGATAALLLVVAERFGLSRRIGWAFALLVSANPMIFLYAGTGMAEGVVAPFLVGAVACLTLFWHTGRRGWVAGAGVALGLGFAAAYETVPLGVALTGALVAGLFLSSEARRPFAPLGRLRAAEGLGILLVFPSVVVALLFVGANAVIMGDPLFFVRGAYGYGSYRAEAFTGGAESATGDLLAVAALVGERAWPFLVPLGFLLVVRALDRRLWRIESLSLTVIGLSVTCLLIAPMAFQGSRMDFLRYYIYPLFVAAGWGLYEIATSDRRRRAACIVLAGWAVAVPVCVWTMSRPALAIQEYPEYRAVVTGRDARALGYGDPVVTRAPLAAYLEREVVPRDGRVLLDAFQGAAVAAQLSSRSSGHLIMTFDRRFRAALADPDRHQITHVLVPAPAVWPQDAVTRARPALWAGREPGFRLIRRFQTTAGLPEEWRLFRVGPGIRVLPIDSGGGG